MIISIGRMSTEMNSEPLDACNSPAHVGPSQNCRLHVGTNPYIYGTFSSKFIGKLTAMACR